MQLGVKFHNVCNILTNGSEKNTYRDKADMTNHSQLFNQGLCMWITTILSTFLLCSNVHNKRMGRPSFQPQKAL